MTPPSPHEPDRRSVSEPAINIPPATLWLVIINVIVHLARMILLSSDRDDEFVDMFGFNPAALHGAASDLTPVTLITYQFLHGGWDHLGMNMISLIAFGTGVERPAGKGRYLFIYFVTGIIGALVEAGFTPTGVDDRLIGASASISGVFGALLVIWGVHLRGNRPLGILRMALLWSALLAITGIAGVGANGSQVAWIAHIGGFIAGIGLGVLVRPRAR